MRLRGASRVAAGAVGDASVAGALGAWATALKAAALAITRTVLEKRVLKETFMQWLLEVVTKNLWPVPTTQRMKSG